MPEQRDDGAANPSTRRDAGGGGGGRLSSIVKRGFTLSHQKATLAIDLATGTIQGVAELTIVPAAGELRTVYLNFRSGRVKSVAFVPTPSLSTTEAGGDALDAAATALPPPPEPTTLPFSHNDPTQQISLSAPKDPRIFPEAKRKAFSAYAEGDEGELAVSLPPELIQLVQQQQQQQADPAEPLKEEYAPVVVRIEYEVRAGGEGLAFFSGEDGIVSSMEADGLVVPRPSVPGVHLTFSVTEHASPLHVCDNPGRSSMLDPLRRLALGPVHVGARLCCRPPASGPRGSR